MSAVPDTAVLSVDTVNGLVGSIRSSFEAAWQHYEDGCRLLVEAYQGKAWLALGISDWEAFISHTLDVDHLKIPRAERQQIVRSLREGGLTVRDIAFATGLGVGTVHRELPVPNGTPANPVDELGRAVAELQENWLKRLSEIEKLDIESMDLPAAEAVTHELKEMEASRTTIQQMIGDLRQSLAARMDVAESDPGRIT